MTRITELSSRNENSNATAQRDRQPQTMSNLPPPAPTNTSIAPATIAGSSSSNSLNGSGSSTTTSITDNYLIPNFLLHDVLVPLKIDVTYKGARYVDTFCWNLYHPALLPEEFAMRTCHDLNFPIGFHQKISFFPKSFKRYTFFPS